MKVANGGMLWVDRVGDRASCAILTQNFSGKSGPQYKNGRNRRFAAFYGAGSLAPEVELSGNNAMDRNGGELGFMALRGLLSLQAKPP
jgi:hypothetical protein